MFDVTKPFYSAYFYATESQTMPRRAGFYTNGKAYPTYEGAFNSLCFRPRGTSLIRKFHYELDPENPDRYITVMDFEREV